jgi:hypothetical protein
MENLESTEVDKILNEFVDFCKSIDVKFVGKGESITIDNFVQVVTDFEKQLSPNTSVENFLSVTANINYEYRFENILFRLMIISKKTTEKTWKFIHKYYEQVEQNRRNKKWNAVPTPEFIKIVNAARIKARDQGLRV